MNENAGNLGHKAHGGDGHSNGHIKASNGNTVPQLRGEESVKPNGEMNSYHPKNGTRNTSSNGIMSDHGVKRSGKDTNSYIFVNGVSR